MPGEARPFYMQSGGTSAGSESPIFAGRIEKSLFGSTRELNIPISSAAYESPIGLTTWTAVQLVIPNVVR